MLLHDFPEFLCEYHFQLCNVIPPSCIQMRNLILSAFPRNMRLPDPFTPNLKVDLLPEINQSPRFVPEPQNLLPAELRYCLTSRLSFAAPQSQAHLDSIAILAQSKPAAYIGVLAHCLHMLRQASYKHILAWRCCSHQHASLVLMALIQLSMLPLSKLCNQAH